MTRRTPLPKRGAKSSRSAAAPGLARGAGDAEAAAPAAARAGIPSALARGLAALTGGVSERIATSSGVGMRVGKALLLARNGSAMRREAGRTLRAAPPLESP